MSAGPPSRPGRSGGAAALTLALVLGGTASLSGCATLSRGASNVVLPTEEEIALGRQMSQEVEKEMPLVKDAEVQRYIQGLGDQIVRGTRGKRSQIDFTFKVIDRPDEVNAFALPGGWIYVFSGLLLEAENEAELMSVLGHEVAHVTARHVAERLTAAYGLQMLSSLALGENPGALKQAVAGLAAQGYLLKFGRDQERQADTWGVEYEINAGWDPHGFLTFFEKLKTDGPRMPAWLSSHPLPEDRIEHVRAILEERGSVPSKDGRQGLQAIQSRLR